MGYTHHFRTPKTISGNAWSAFLGEAKMLHAALAKDHPEIGIFGGDGESEPEFNDEAVCFNGDESKDLAHETFVVEREMQPMSHQKADENGLYYSFCKTNRKPYDLLVGACLIALKQHVPECRIGSDGGSDDWAEIYQFHKDVTGRDTSPESLFSK